MRSGQLATLSLALFYPLSTHTHTQYQTNFEQITNHCAQAPLPSNFPFKRQTNFLVSLLTDESILSEDPTPAETTHHGGGTAISGISSIGSSSSGVGAGASIGSGPIEKQSTLLILAAVVAIGVVVVTSIIVAGIVVVCRHRPRPPEPQEVRKSMR